MDYVCKIVGNLSLKEINLELSYLEIIDLSQEDFKASPRLREALRNKEIEIYDLRKHQTAKRIKFRNNNERVQIIKEEIIKEKLVESTKIPNEINSLKKLLLEMSSKLNQLIFRVDTLLAGQQGPKEVYDLSKLDLILEKIEGLTTKGFVFNEKDFSNIELKTKISEEVPIYVPQLNIEVTDKNIVSLEQSLEGTEDILEKLKKLKGQ